MQQKQQKSEVSQIMNELLKQNPNIQDVKDKVNGIILNSNKHIYWAMIQSEQKYLQIKALTYHEEEHFNYLNHLLHRRTNSILDKIGQGQIQLQNPIHQPPKEEQQEKVPQQIIDEVEYVLSNIDLPLSLFKRNDRYWSSDNPKTIQVKEYIKQLHDKDRQWKGDLKRKRQSILNQRNEKYHKQVEENKKVDQKQKEQQKIRALKKIQHLKSSVDHRKKSIEESLEFMKKKGRPMFKKMEEQYKNKIQMPNLEAQKRKLIELRELRRSIDMTQIQQHKQKCEKLQQQHEKIKITNEPVKVQFKGRFYQSLEKSRQSVQTIDQSRAYFDKKKQYAAIVKEKFKPTINDDLANQIEQRIKQMGKKRARTKRNRKASANNDDEEQQQQEEQEQKEPSAQEDEEEEDEGEDDEDEDGAQKPDKDDQYEPNNKERYKMGLKYLEQAKLRRAKHKQIQPENQNEVKNKTFSVKDIKQVKISPNRISVLNQADNEQSKYDRPKQKRIEYKNYLHELSMSRTSKTIDYLDSDKIKKQLHSDAKLRQRPNKSKVIQFQNNIKFAQEKVRMQEELLKHKRTGKDQAIGKKAELDNALVHTIKARLALMES